jgi:hypothetical protein
MEKTWHPELSYKDKLTRWGIYIVATHHVEGTILENLESWTSTKFPSDIEENSMNKNLSFSEVYEEFTQYVGRGRDIPPISLHTADIETKDTSFASRLPPHVKQYDYITLTRIVKAFKAMGFEMINIIDFSCQYIDNGIISDTKTDPFKLVRQSSIGSTRKGTDNMKKLFETKTGGKTRKQQNRKIKKRKTQKINKKHNKKTRKSCK